MPQPKTKLTPARARALHAKLDKLIQSNDSGFLNAVVLLMDTLSRSLPARHKRSSADQAESGAA